MMPKKTSTKPIRRVILFGGAPLLVATSKWLRKNGYELHVYTSPRHAAEPVEADGSTLAQALARLGIKFVSTEDINAEASLLPLIDHTTLGIGMGEAWSFNRDLIDRFGGRLLDFMGIPHPRYRGGAHYTWMILRGDKEGGCNLQIINADMVQGVFDSGEIVASRKYRFPSGARIPQDYFDAAVKQEVRFIETFLGELKRGKRFVPKKPDESRSLHLPRLHTLHNGWIDWSWDGAAIERFICAFDAPYKGASTFVDGRRVHLKSARLVRGERPFHPFQSGLITRIWAGKLSVATASGHLEVERVAGEDGSDLLPSLKIGMRFMTPHLQLEQAMAYSPDYGAVKK